MPETVHNPDQYMYDFKHILTHGRKKIGLLIGAGAPVSINVGDEINWKSLIPDVAGLTEMVKGDLDEKELVVFELLEKEIPNSNIELILSRVRSLAEVIGTAKVHDLDSKGYTDFSKTICRSIKTVVSQPLPDSENPYSDTISWINGINRDHAVEVFTTNYDLLFEAAMERARTPYFDGFSGSREAFFDPSSISSNDLPPRWVRLWKLHGSINWSNNESGEIIRAQGEGEGEGIMVYPSHIKYDQTQSAPFSSLFERLKNFLLVPDSLLITAGFSFADAHISAKLGECMAENSSAAILAFQYRTLAEECFATDIAKDRPNMSVYCKDGAVINGVKAKWHLGDLPSKNWEIIRGEYWDDGKFVLGDFLSFSKFLAKSGGGKSISPVATEKIEGVSDDK
jgi:hypothetical protein